LPALLAFACRDDAEIDTGPYSADRIENNLVYLGLAGLSDPVRPEVPEAIRACHTAGIRVIMITGDYALTAASVGRRIGLGQNSQLKIFTGAEISRMDDGTLREIVGAGEIIFARVAPEHKLRIVSVLKELGEIVAVTGDGVNDAPALKKADIGIAMGLRGNDVAKEAAHMILTDDNFTSIVAAIEEGRAIFDNIKRFAAYVLNSNPQEMYPYMVWVLERPVIIPLTAWLARFLERHHVIYNLVANPLIDIGILCELLLCYLFFYSSLAGIYYFAPVPWHVYLFAFHGMILLLAFEEVKKYYRRKGFALENLG
jgi:magnesium-transporting ATPase (P-type)